MLVTGKEEKLDCNIPLALWQSRTLELRLAKNESFKMKYSDSIKKDLAKGYIALFLRCELERRDVWYLPHYPVVNPRKPEKVRRVCNAAKRYREYCLNDVLLKIWLESFSRKLCCINCRYWRNVFANSIAGTRKMLPQVSVDRWRR